LFAGGIGANAIPERTNSNMAETFDMYFRNDIQPGFTEFFGGPQDVLGLIKQEHMMHRSFKDHPHTSGYKSKQSGLHLSDRNLLAGQQNQT